MAIYQKINEVMRRVRGVEKGSHNTFSGYRYAGHEAVTDALRDHYAELGIVRHAACSDLQVRDDGTIVCMVLVTFLDVQDGDRIELAMPAVQPSQAKNRAISAQQVGQAISYAVKNVEFKLFALTGDPEPDSEHDNPEERAPEPAERAKPSHEAQSAARALLDAMRTAKTEDEVARIQQALRADWPKLKGVRGLAEAVVAERTSALMRIRGES